MCAQIAWKITWGKQRETEIVWFNYSWMARNESSFETILKYTRKLPTCLIMRKSRTERIVSASYPLSHNQCKGSVGSQIEHQIHQLWGPLKFEVLIFLKKVERIIQRKTHILIAEKGYRSSIKCLLFPGDITVGIYIQQHIPVLWSLWPRTTAQAILSAFPFLLLPDQLRM